MWALSRYTFMCTIYHMFVYILLYMCIWVLRWLITISNGIYLFIYIYIWIAFDATKCVCLIDTCECVMLTTLKLDAYVHIYAYIYTFEPMRVSIFKNIFGQRWACAYFEPNSLYVCMYVKSKWIANFYNYNTLKSKNICLLEFITH